MSSSRAGVQGRILQVAPLASYIHCSGHCLNLVITKSCAVPDIRYVLDRLKYCCKFFINSPKRSGLLEQVVSANVTDAEKRKPLLDLCKTRWAERHVAYQRFYQGLPFIVEALEVMGYKRHIEKYGRDLPRLGAESSERGAADCDLNHIVFIYGDLHGSVPVPVTSLRDNCETPEDQPGHNQGPRTCERSQCSLQGGAPRCGRWVFKDFSAEHPSGGESWC